MLLWIVIRATGSEPLGSSTVKDYRPTASVVIYERSRKPLRQIIRRWDIRRTAVNATPAWTVGWSQLFPTRKCAGDRLRTTAGGQEAMGMRAVNTGAANITDPGSDCTCD